MQGLVLCCNVSNMEILSEQKHLKHSSTNLSLVIRALLGRGPRRSKLHHGVATLKPSGVLS